MRILHLTDLHLTEVGPSLADLWAGLESELPNREFDAAIISGDLTQDASSGKNNYDDVRAFLDKTIVPRVKGGEKNRVVIVPGNHDVDWTIEVGTTVPVDHVNTDPDLREAHQIYRSAPERSSIRYVVELFTTKNVVRLKPDLYVRRLENFSKFLSEFYGDSLKAPSRPFNFKTPHEDQHWSAHVFLDEGVAICGFNSCAANDKYWRGASLSPKAVSAASAYLDEHAPNCIRVAVWHHGLTAPRGSPDHLTIGEVGQLVASGFRVGVHGHTHEDELKTIFDALRKDFPIVATGSFAAGASERPGGVRNQASMISLNRAYLRWQVYERDDQTRQWRRERSDTFIMPSGDGTRARTPKYSECGRHTRSMKVDANGIATITVGFEDLVAEEDLVLASPRARTHQMDHDEHADAVIKGSTFPLEVRAEKSVGEGVRFVPRLNPEQHIDRLTWSYSVGGIFALDGSDARMAPRKERDNLALKPEEEAWIHTVRIHAEQLTLELTLAKPTIKSARLRAQAHNPERSVHDPDREWEDDPVETKRVQNVTVGPDKNHVTVTIPDPRLGYRYALIFDLETIGPELDSRTSLLLQNVVQECRHNTQIAGGSIDTLTTVVGGGIRQALNVQPTDDLCFWIVHLWEPSLAKLVPCFGSFPARSWSSEFEYGLGVAGHAFRVRGPSLFFRSSTNQRRGGSDKSHLLYLERDHGSGHRDHSWVVSVPLLVGPGQAAVGVLSFSSYADEHSRLPAYTALRDLANLSVLGPEGVSDADAKSSLEALTYAAAEGFWKAIAEGEVPVSLHGRKLAQEVYAKHWQLNRASAAPLAPSSVTLTAPITAPSPVAIAKGET